MSDELNLDRLEFKKRDFFCISAPDFCVAFIVDFVNYYGLRVVGVPKLESKSARIFPFLSISSLFLIPPFLIPFVHGINR